MQVKMHFLKFFALEGLKMFFLKIPFTKISEKVFSLWKSEGYFFYEVFVTVDGFADKIWIFAIWQWILLRDVGWLDFQHFLRTLEKLVMIAIGKWLCSQKEKNNHSIAMSNTRFLY